MPHPPTLTAAVHGISQLNDLQAKLKEPQYQYYSPQVIATLGNPESNPWYQIASVGFARIEYQEKILSFQSQLTKTLFDAGIMLLSGTDAAIDGGPVFGFSLHDELALLVDAGLTPYQALATSTRNSAIAMQALNERGTVEEGKQADLLLLNANPLGKYCQYPADRRRHGARSLAFQY